MTKGLKITLVASSIVLVGVGVYLAYNYFNPKPTTKKDDKSGTPQPTENKSLLSTITNAVKNTVSDVVGVNTPFPLNVGSKGSNVRDLQNLLNSLGASPQLDVDGDYGNATKSALLQYVVNYPPFANGVDSDGYNWLQNRLSGKNVAQQTQGGNVLASFGIV